MINVRTFQSNLPKQFKNPRVVAHDVLRCEEMDEQDRLFALHYFAMTDDLVKAAKDLGEFQDEVLGHTYYETQGDLRWNHYLYFITDENSLASPEGLKEKERIEGDRSYARKYVLTDKQFIDILNQQELSISASETGVAAGILNRWTEKLMNSKLDVILEQKGLAETVRAIGEGTQTRCTRSNSVKQTRGIHPLARGFISKLEIKRFRDFLIDRTFENFGSVNLIVGSNGTGKTSILEAIEYLFCSDNARISPIQPVHIRGYIQDQSKTIEINPSTASDDLKSRNLTWYGTRDLRGSSLANSFARYNFLNTDEAVLLAQDPKVDFDELLSRVVAGPQAAELWSHINKLISPLETEISKTETKLQRLAAEKATAQEQIANAGASPNQADHAFLALCEDLRRLKWKSQIDKVSIETEVLPNLQRAYSLVREILAADWTEGAAIPRAIRKQRDDERHRVASLRDFVGKISEMRKKIFDIEATIQSHSQTLNLIDEIEQILSSGVLDVIKAIKEEEEKIICERKLITEVSLLSGFQDFVETRNTKVSIDEDLNVVLEKERQLLMEIQQVSTNLERLRKTKSSNQVLLQDIRHLARRLIDQQHDIKHCPVCRSEFDEIELRRRIEESVESSADEALEIVAKQFDDLTNKQMLLKSKKTLLDDAIIYARNKGFDTALIDLPDILKDISEVRTRIVSAEERLGRSRKQMAALAKAGFSEERVLGLMNQVKIAGINMASSQDLAEARLSVERVRKMLEDRFLEEKRSLGDLKKESLFTFSSSLDATQVPTEERMLLITEQRCTAIENAILSLDYINGLLNIDEDASITTLSTLIGSATSAAEKYVAACANEQRLGGIEQKARQRMSKIEADIGADNQKLKQLRYAHSVLNEIRVKDSLEQDTESELQAVSQVTAAIFSNIHSPREYGVKRGLERPLFKLNSKRAVSLKEVSTGQRAAFVLSLFLAMNAKLQTAPKVLLFDDPIAHVDDLNSLSFLDHLRHLVLTGRRQVFYATADTRLAGLIEHKFGFLGSAFKRIDLTR